MDLTEVRQRMADGRLYVCNDPELFAEQGRRRDVLDAYNTLPFGSSEERDSTPIGAAQTCTWATTSMPTWGSRWWTTRTSSSRTTS